MAAAVVYTLPDAAALVDSVVVVVARHRTIDDEDDCNTQPVDVVDDEL